MWSLWFIIKINVLLRLGKIDNVCEIAKHLIQQNSKKFKFLLSMAVKLNAQTKLETKQIVIDLLNYINIHSTGEQFETATYSLGIFYFNNYLFEEANEYFLQISYLNHPIIIAYLLESSHKLERLDLVEGYINKLKNSWEFNPDAIISQGKLLRYYNEAKEIRQLYENYLANAPDLVVSHYFMGNYLLEVETDYLGAKQKFEDALELIDNDPYYSQYEYFFHTENLLFSLNWDYLGVLIRLREFDKAEEHSKSTLDGESYRLWKASYHMMIDEDKLALDYLQKILIRNNISVSYRHIYQSELGQVHLILGSYSIAEAVLLESIHIGENLWSPIISDYVNMSVCLDAQAKSGGEQYLKKAVDLDKNEAYGALVTIYFKMKKWDKIIKTINQYKEDIFTIPNIFESLAHSYFQVGDYKNAIQEYLHLLEMQPGNFRAMFDLARAYNKVGDLKNVGVVKERILSIESLPESFIKEAQEL